LKTAGKTSPTLSIATFNAGLLKVTFAGLSVFEFTPFTEERLRAIPHALTLLDCDVICLQEVYDERSAKLIRKALEKSHPFWYRQPTRRMVLVGNGLMVLSRFELTGMGLRVFRAQMIDERLFAPRAMMYARIQVPHFGTIGIYNVHLTAGGAFHHPEAVKSDEIRTRQVEELIEHAGANGLDVQIMAGDFNCGSNISTEPYSRIPQAGYSDAPSIAKGREIDEWITWDPANPLNRECPHKTSPPQRIDHVFIKTKALEHLTILDAGLILSQPQVAIQGKKPVSLSDHVGIQVRFGCSDSLPS